MATKFPTQNKLDYLTGALSNDGFTAVGNLCVPKDLSLLNMRGYESTTRKGVPLVYRVKFDIYQQDYDGKQVGLDASSAPAETADSDADTAAASDHSTILRVEGCQNNWVMRNAAVKWHAAREKMFRDSGVTKRSRGAYSHTIRYGFDSYNDTFLTPVDGAGDAFTTGTWDLSKLSYDANEAFYLTLVGSGDDEETDLHAGNELSIGHSYIMSRQNQQADTNLETDEGPAKFSTLLGMLAPQGRDASDDNVVVEGRDAQDNPPYEVLDSPDVNHNITEAVELGRAIAGTGSAFGSVVVDIPFGICEVQARHSGATDQNIIDQVMFSATVLDIYEMQG